MPILTSLDEFGGVLQIASGCEAAQLAACVHPAAASTTDTAPPDDGRDYYHDAGAWVPRPGRPSPAHEWRPAARAWVDPRTLEDLRIEAWARIKARRAQAEFGGFVWDGSPFDSDEISQSKVQGAAVEAYITMASGRRFSTTWTLADNTRRRLSAADMIAAGLAMGAHIKAAHDHAADLRELINAATTAEQLEAITWDD